MNYFLKSLRSYGKLRANPLANIENTFKFSPCECSETLNCEGELDFTAAGTAQVTGIKLGSSVHGPDTYAAETIIFDNPILANEPDKLLSAIYEGMHKYVINPWLNVDYVGGNLKVKWIAAKSITHLIVGGTDRALTQKCNVENECTYQMFFVDNVSPFILGAATENVANGPFAFDPVDNAANLTVAGNLVTEITATLTALGVATTSVTADPDYGSETFKVVIKTSDVQMDEVETGGNQFTNCGCQKIFTV